MAHKKNTNEILIHEAEVWLVRLRSDQATVEDKARFSDWLNTSEEHIEAFDQVCELWETLGAVAYVTENTAAKPRAPNTSARAKASAAQIWAFLFRHPLQTGIGLVCLLLVSLSLQFSPSSTQPDTAVPVVSYQTQAGQLLDITLDDGSQVQLNTQTVLQVLYLRDQRRVTLLKGEAYFDVTKDKNRPFVVDFGRGLATAVGTSFNIYRERATTEVTVTEGIVDVSEAPDLIVKNPEVTRVLANQQVKVGRRGVSPTRNVESSRATAWREYTIIFKDTPLRDAFEQLERYLPYAVDTTSIFDEKVSGTFSLNSPDETLDALVTAFNLIKKHSDDNNILYLRQQ